MSVSKPTELRKFLDSLGTRAKKSLSQNFLIDGNILRKIVHEADIHPGDRVLEIGSGPGALTECLLATGAHVIAVEKDDVFASALQRFPSVEVYSGDIRNFPFERYFSSQQPQKTKVVANLPYHLTTPILALLMPRHTFFSSVTVMVQEEVARRMTAFAGSSDYSSLSVFLRFYSTPRYAFTVSNRCFYPVPNVQSAVVSLSLNPPPSISEEAFFRLVRTAFGQRRKMLRSTLKTLYPTIENALHSLSLPPQARPENLSCEAFLSLFKVLNPLQ